MYVYKDKWNEMASNEYEDKKKHSMHVQYVYVQFNN